MATRIRLQRHGKKGKAFFHIVAADSRAKRDGKFIEKLGTYNPNTNPATIEINFDRTLNWVQTGAEMSDTARAILSYKGVLYKNHLIKGIAKGALTEDKVEEKFNLWLQEKEGKITGKKEGLSKSADSEKAARMKAETDAKEARSKAIEAKYAPEPVAEEATEESAADTAEEGATDNAVEASAENTEATEVATETTEEETKTEE